MLLYVDTATSGPWIHPRTKDGFSPADEAQPYLVRLAWALEGKEGRISQQACHVVRPPEGVTMDPAQAFKTSLFDWVLADRGLGARSVLEELTEALGKAEAICGFNWQHQRHVLDCSLRRVGRPVPRWPPHHCAMQEVTNLVQEPRLQPGGGYKWPSFERAYLHFRMLPWSATTNVLADGMDRVHAIHAMHHAAQLARGTESIQTQGQNNRRDHYGKAKVAHR